MKIEQREFEINVPKADGSGVAEKVKLMVPVYWDEEVQDWLMTPEAHALIDNTKCRLMGLLLPSQLKELRERFNYTQKEMGELFQVGEKSWTRWESGKHRPTRVINVLIRALFDEEISINYLLEIAGKPSRETNDAAKIQHFISTMIIHAAEAPYARLEGDAVGSAIQFESKGTAKPVFLTALLHQSPQQPQSFWPPTSKRFDFENAKIA